MLTYRQIEDVGEAATRLFEETERTIINDMARRISRLGEVTAATDWQMLRLELTSTMRSDIMRELSNTLHMSEQRIYDLFDEAATRTLDSDNRAARAAGHTPIPLAENSQLQQTIRAGLAKTKDTFVNLTMTTANESYKQFVNALDLAHQLMTDGAYSYQHAIREGINSLANNGLNSFVDFSGRKDHVDVAFRRALLTGINQTCATIQFENLSQMGVDLVETTAHPGARPDHAVWQGKVFSLSGTHPKYQNFYTETAYGEAYGLCGVNCRHSFFPWFEGLSNPAYTAEKLREYNEKRVTFNGEEMSLYDATQHQRYIERQIRKWKRKAGAEDAGSIDSVNARIKVQQWQAAQRDFIKQTGLSRDYFREGGAIKNVLPSVPNNGIISAGGNMVNKPIEFGHPVDVAFGARELSERQQVLIDNLPRYGSKVTVSKNEASMLDLSALTAKTGDEFAMFTKGGERLIVRGNAERVPFLEDELKALYNEGYKFSGHTHPGITEADLIASGGDMKALSIFNQNRSVIYNAVGKHRVYERTE